MAAAEARAAWQRAANRCLVQEDRKRAPKLACCPPPSELHYGTNNGNRVNFEDRPISSLMPLSCNPMNMPPDIRTWRQQQLNFGIQKDLISEVSDKKVEDTAPEQPLLCETFGTSVEKSADLFEPPWMVSASFMNYSSERSLDELRTTDGYSQVPLKRRGSVLYEDKELLDLESSNPSPLKNQQKDSSDMDSPWKEIEKAQPWWQITDENELASLVAERAIRHIENCDLPIPTQTVRVHRTESHGYGSACHSGAPSSPDGRISYPGFHGQCEHIDCSYSSESTDEPSLSNNRVRQQHDRNYSYSPAQDFSNNSTIGWESKLTFPNELERDQILEALCHSQTRAREAEMAAKKASSEKDDVINLLLRQASHLFACNQWLKILQLENIGLQIKQKEDQIATVVPELPWMTPREKTTQGHEQNDWSRRKGRRKKKGGSFFDTILFAVGLGLAGAGFLLGWTLGWLLPKS